MRTALRFIGQAIFGETCDPGPVVGAIILVAPILLAAFSYTQYGWPGVSWTLGMGYIVIVVAILQRVGLQRWK
jgi:hypothetical protein